MAKASENKFSSFKPYLDTYEDLLHKMQDSTSQLEITKLTKEVHNTLQLLFKAMMSFYEQQHQQNLKYVEENRARIEKISHKTVVRAQTVLERSLKQSQDMMDKQVNYLKQVYRMQPKEFLDDAMSHAAELFNEQSKIWQNMYEQQKDDAEEDLKYFQQEAKKMMQHTESLRQDMLTLFHDLETRFHEVLVKKQKVSKGKTDHH